MYKYIGPKYNNGIKIPGIPGMQKPGSWTKEQIAAFKEKDPKRFSAYFEVPKGNKTEAAPPTTKNK